MSELTKAEQAVAKARQIASLMLDICRLCERDNEIGELICQSYPFKGSLDEVAHEALAWRDAMAEKAGTSYTPGVEFVPYPSDCGSCHGKPDQEVLNCGECGGTGEHQS